MEAISIGKTIGTQFNFGIVEDNLLRGLDWDSLGKLGFIDHMGTIELDGGIEKDIYQVSCESVESMEAFKSIIINHGEAHQIAEQDFDGFDF